MLSFGSYSEFALELSKGGFCLFCFVLFGVCCFIISVTVVYNFISLCVCVSLDCLLLGGGGSFLSFLLILILPLYIFFLLTLRLMPCTVAFLNELFLHLVLIVSMEMF